MTMMTPRNAPLPSIDIDGNDTQRQMARALRQGEERFRQVVEFAPYAMVMVNGAGNIEMVNAQAERVFGFSRSEMLGQPIDMLVPERFRGHHMDLHRSFFHHPEARSMGARPDLYGLRKDGHEFPAEIGLNPIETDEGTMVLSAIVDISDRKHKEQSIQAALKEKDILLGEIHHRVKNNLQIVNSLLDLQSAPASSRTSPAFRSTRRHSSGRISLGVRQPVTNAKAAMPRMCAGRWRCTRTVPKRSRNRDKSSRLARAE